MKYKIAVALLFCISTVAYSQKDSSTYYKFELTFSTGWNNTWEPFPVGFGYKPRILKQALMLNAVFNINTVEGVKLQGGIGIYPLKNKKVIPYLGADYIIATGGYELNDNNGAGVLVNYNTYVYPYLGIKFSPSKNDSYYIIIARFGYSYLLKTNPHPITLVGGTQEDYDYALNRVKSNYMASLGIAFPFNSLKLH